MASPESLLLGPALARGLSKHEIQSSASVPRERLSLSPAEVLATSAILTLMREITAQQGPLNQTIVRRPCCFIAMNGRRN
jgi:hypothetical protein